MANTVAQILANLKSSVATVLGSTFHELQDSVNLKANTLRGATKGYSIKADSAETASGTTRAYTLDQVFEVTLVDVNPRRNDDLGLQSVLNSLYDYADQILVEIFHSKLSLPGIVLSVERANYERPEFVNGKEYIVLKARFTIKLRNEVA